MCYFDGSLKSCFIIDVQNKRQSWRFEFMVRDIPPKTHNVQKVYEYTVMLPVVDLPECQLLKDLLEGKLSFQKMVFRPVHVS